MTSPSNPIASPFALRLMLFAVLFCGCAGPSTNRERTTPAPRATLKRLLLGTSGLRIELVEYETGMSLARATGVKDLYEGKVVQVTTIRRVLGAARSFEVVSYQTMRRGREQTLLYANTKRQRARFFYLGSIHHRRPLELKAADRATAHNAIDPAALFRQHQRQRLSGALSFQRYDRGFWVAGVREHLRKAVEELNRGCGSSASAEVVLGKTTDEQLKEHGYDLVRSCRDLVFSLISKCSWLEAKKRPAMRAFFARIKTVSCHPVAASKPRATLAGGALKIVTKPGRQIRVEAEDVQLASGMPLEKALSIAASDICKAGARYILTRHKESRLCYGDKDRYHCVRLRPSRVGCRYFYDPRHTQFKAGRLLWGSCIEIDRAKRRCTLRCGSSQKVLPLLADRSLMKKATYHASPFQRVPHALARDRRGVYYYVDRGRRRASKDYRVFIGRRGKLKRQQMIDVVDDSEGQIFQTKRGKLRLILSKSTGQWIRGRKTRPLKLVPVKRNLPLIHRELGVYWGKRLATPCDDI